MGAAVLAYPPASGGDPPSGHKATRVALDMEGHLDTDPWALGDALVEDIGVPEIIGAGPNDPTKTGLFAPPGAVLAIRKSTNERGK